LTVCIPGKEYPGSKQEKSKEGKTISMDDLVITGVLSLIGVFIASVMLLYGLFVIAGLVVSLIVMGEYGKACVIVLGIFIFGFLYIETGCWLHKTGRI
jgi:VIT1/CCC1 family predicted Fe2+/Mn2+ transporter